MVPVLLSLLWQLCVVLECCIPLVHHWLVACRGVLQELESVVTRARHFQFKPDGEVTFMMAQDAVGLPAPLMQVCCFAALYPANIKFRSASAALYPVNIKCRCATL